MDYKKKYIETFNKNIKSEITNILDLSLNKNEKNLTDLIFDFTFGECNECGLKKYCNDYCCDVFLCKNCKDIKFCISCEELHSECDMVLCDDCESFYCDDCFNNISIICGNCETQTSCCRDDNFVEIEVDGETMLFCIECSEELEEEKEDE